MSKVPLVLVTGASGFIATHIVQQLLHGGYQVRGTVRSLNNEAKIKPLREMCINAKYPLELVEADLLESQCWKDAVKGCTYVLHTASPFRDSKNDAELIRPAVDGTVAVLRACEKESTVRRVILTSSCSAVNGGFDTRLEEYKTFSEKDWTDPQRTQIAYAKSKTLSEKAAWDFVTQRDTGFELAVINPCYVMGPILCGGHALSMELPKRLLEHSIPAVPHLNLAIVDVRDVAAAHISAMACPEAAGHRHILATDYIWIKEMADIYHEEFGPMGYWVPRLQAPYLLMRFVALFNSSTRLFMPSWGKITAYDNTRMKTVLDINPRPVTETLLDMAHSLIQKGFVKKTNSYKNN